VRRRVILLTLAFAIVPLYLVALTYAIAFAAAQETPRWWISIFPTWRSAALTWVLSLHALAIALASLPFAWVISRFYGRPRVWVALAIAVVITLVLAVPSGPDLTKSPGAFLVSIWVADALQFVVTLPLLALLLSRLPSNNRWRGP
jgi:hypothetical protein